MAQKLERWGITAEIWEFESEQLSMVKPSSQVKSSWSQSNHKLLPEKCYFGVLLNLAKFQFWKWQISVCHTEHSAVKQGGGQVLPPSVENRPLYEIFEVALWYLLLWTVLHHEMTTLQIQHSKWILFTSTAESELGGGKNIFRKKNIVSFGLTKLNTNKIYWIPRGRLLWMAWMSTISLWASGSFQW